MKIIFSLINSMTFALSISLYLFNWMWLQMRVNVGYIFIILFLLFFIIYMLLSNKFTDRMKIMYSILLFVALFIIAVVSLGFNKIVVIAPAIIRNGIRLTRIPFSVFNTFIIIFYVLLMSLLIILIKKENLRIEILL